MDACATKPYITVHFDDGPESGLLASVSEHDTCDSRYWKFAEVHKTKPLVKVIFADDLTIFAGEWPKADEGTIVDEDGDAHHYVLEEHLSTSVVAAEQHVVEKTHDVVPRLARLRRVRDTDDDDWSEATPQSIRARRSPLIATGASAGQRRSTPMDNNSRRRTKDGLDRGRKRKLCVGVQEDEMESEERCTNNVEESLVCDQQRDLFAEEKDIETSVPHAEQAMKEDQKMENGKEEEVEEGEEKDKERNDQQEKGEQEEDEEAEQVEGENEEAQKEHVKETDSRSNDKGETGLHSFASLSELGVVEGKLPPGLGNGGYFDDVMELPMPAEGGGEDVVCRRGIFVERAKSSRSSCKTCKAQISQGCLRCGVDAFSGGRTARVWAHGACFLGELTAEYCPARRGKCKGSGRPFEKGDIRVMFKVGAHCTWWSPGEAAQYVSQIFEEAKRELGLPAVKARTTRDPEHIGELSALLQTRVGSKANLKGEHASRLFELLRSGNTEGDVQLRCEPAELKKRRKQASRTALTQHASSTVQETPPLARSKATFSCRLGSSPPRTAVVLASHKENCVSVENLTAAKPPKFDLEAESISAHLSDPEKNATAVVVAQSSTLVADVRPVLDLAADNSFSDSDDDCELVRR
eukprot:TRINITY_DN12522_c1_g1_i1.p1 TRINITY_DN12522_c1_g1~~TRINITY_DN12522_c1_g1_i1.p1  ORF type:complete len:638 (+),score=143.15 TRINITY_DN12522_c1_g1_i1:282-2195(+)